MTEIQLLAAIGRASLKIQEATERSVAMHPDNGGMASTVTKLITEQIRLFAEYLRSEIVTEIEKRTSGAQS